MTALIELDRISKKFGRFPALDNISLQITAGITGLLGPNGAGKSTLIKILLGLLHATSGRGRVLDYELGRQQRAIRGLVGFMPEDDCFLFGLTGVESVQLSAQLSRLPRIEGLRRAHEILDFCGVEQERYRTVETYSTGMRQKLRFAQAIVHDPPILILDEPTSGLDPEEREAMLARIGRLASDHGKAILISTHILPDVQAVSDAVVIIAQGQVRVADRLETLSQPAEPSLRVRLHGRLDLFTVELERSGVTVEPQSNGTVVLRSATQDLTRLAWQAALRSGTAIRSISPSRNSMEEIFLNAVQEPTRDRT